ncbi:MAG TPA: hypothetical protein VFJ87_12310 [Rhodanobacteraceae bacterium]|nr:hypothetical protein [Rhodanobacteraceae bacterium]
MNPAWRARGGWLVAVTALAWGFAEATLFFIVPDVFITWVALRSRRRALVCCALVVAAAMLGGALMYVWSLHDPAAQRAMLLKVPAIDAGLIDRAHAELQRWGGFGLVLGGFSGVPYKLYAAQAAAAGLSPPVLLAWTVLARGLRFVLVALLANGVATWLRPRVGGRLVAGIWLLAWVTMYAFYWS